MQRWKRDRVCQIAKNIGVAMDVQTIDWLLHMLQITFYLRLFAIDNGSYVFIAVSV